MKKIILSINLITLAIAPSSLYSMDKNPSSFKKGIELVAKVATAGLALGNLYLAFEPSWKISFGIHDNVEFLSKFDSIPFTSDQKELLQIHPDAQEFIRQQCIIQGVSQPEKIKIKRKLLDNERSFYRKKDKKLCNPQTIHSTILIPSYIDFKNMRFSSALEDSLEKSKSHYSFKRSKAKKELYTHAFTYRHEINHAHYDDTATMMKAGFFVPFFTESVLFLCKKPFGRNKRWVKNILALPSGLVKGY
jgi:hypothetical protein